MSRGRIISKEAFLQMVEAEPVKVHRFAYGDRHVRKVALDLFSSGRLRVNKQDDNHIWWSSTVQANHILHRSESK